MRADAAGDDKFIERSCVEETVGMKVTANRSRRAADIVVDVVELLKGAQACDEGEIKLLVATVIRDVEERVFTSIQRARFALTFLRLPA